MTRNISGFGPRAFTRRSFVVQGGTSIVAGLGLYSANAQLAPAVGPSTYLDVLRMPDSVFAYSGLDHASSLVRSGSYWRLDSVEVETSERPYELSVQVA